MTSVIEYGVNYYVSQVFTRFIVYEAGLSNASNLLQYSYSLEVDFYKTSCKMGIVIENFIYTPKSCVMDALLNTRNRPEAHICR